MDYVQLLQRPDFGTSMYDTKQYAVPLGNTHTLEPSVGGPLMNRVAVLAKAPHRA